MRWPILSRLSIAGRVLLCLAVGVALVAAIGFATRARWMPPLKARVAAWAQEGVAAEEEGHKHAHDDGNSIVVSEQGLNNIGFEPWTVALKPFEETITVPAMVVERPGRSQRQITAPLTGTITRIHIIEGQAVEPRSPLFEIRLTHEEVVVAQRDFLRTAESLDVVNREIARLRAANQGQEGVIAGKRIIEQEYEKQKLEASQRADRQALYLHGLSEAQVTDILKNRKLLPSYTVVAPEHVHDDEESQPDHLFHVQKMLVKSGENLQAGQLLCMLADHCELFLEGRAFEADAQRLRRAAQHGWNITAVALSQEERTSQDKKVDKSSEQGDKSAEENDPGVVQGLKLLYLADRVDPDTRAFLFYLRLFNKVEKRASSITDDKANKESQKAKSAPQFVDWRFRPGQHFHLRVPVKQWKECIKVPINAVVDEGVESYVFVQNSKKFQRTPVHVEYRDRDWAVVANDGSIFPDDVLAGRGAYQLHLALKNKAGGGADPHAGHQH